MLLQVIKNTGCYILPSLKDFVPEIFKLGRTYPTIQSSIYSKHHPRAIIVLKRFYMLYEHMQKCVYMYLSNAKINAKYVSEMYPYVCKSLT